MGFQIVHLPKDKWQGHILPIGYITEEYYDVCIDRRASGFNVGIEKKRFPKPLTVSPKDWDYPDKLYAEHWEGAFAWGVIDGGELVAAIETAPEEWSNRLRVTELWVDPRYQKRGLGRALINVALEQARFERRRAIMLETQSRNTNAVDFYLHVGFSLIGFDACCYKNDDLDRKEVRLEMGILRDKQPRLSADEVELRAESPEDFHTVEELTQRAFWNKYRPGCDEHYLVSRLRHSPDYLPELSRIALVGGRPVGLIMYSRARVETAEGPREVLTFGPLCVAPEYQGRSVGELLFKESAALAKKAGFAAIIIYGEPDYYPRLGFKTCDNYSITTPDGKNFNSFMAYELYPGALSSVSGKFYESPVFEELPPDEVEAFDLTLPPLEKQRFPGQWQFTEKE